MFWIFRIDCVCDVIPAINLTKNKAYFVNGHHITIKSKK